VFPWPVGFDDRLGAEHGKSARLQYAAYVFYNTLMFKRVMEGLIEEDAAEIAPDSHQS
jgi:hypothetical protein